MRIEEEFVVARPPEDVFDYLTDPAHLAEWQTTKTRVEPLTDGPTRQGYRVREWTKPPAGKEFEQVVEFSVFERPSRVRVDVVEGPYMIDGSWTLAPEGEGTRVHFVAEGELSGFMKLIAPVTQRLMARSFAGYHAKLKQNVEAR